MENKRNTIDITMRPIQYDYEWEVRTDDMKIKGKYNSRKLKQERYKR